MCHKWRKRYDKKNMKQSSSGETVSSASHSSRSGTAYERIPLVGLVKKQVEDEEIISKSLSTERILYIKSSELRQRRSSSPKMHYMRSRYSPKKNVVHKQSSSLEDNQIIQWSPSSKNAKESQCPSSSITLYPKSLNGIENPIVVREPDYLILEGNGQYMHISRTLTSDEKPRPQTACSMTSSLCFSVEAGLNVLEENDDLRLRKWIKCRLRLVSRQGRHMLLIYQPPNSERPRECIFLSQIEDVRRPEELNLKMENTEEVFVILTELEQQLMIETHECENWLTTISQFTLAENLANMEKFPSLNNYSSASHSRGAITVFTDFPWYHGKIDCDFAAQLVTINGISGQGTFLIRDSISMPGKMVLTMNCNGIAKHLPFHYVKTTGRIKLQHLFFESIFSLLEFMYFNTIFLVHEKSETVKLTRFVVHKDDHQRPWCADTLHGPDGSLRLLTCTNSVRLTYDKISCEPAPQAESRYECIRRV